MPRFNRRNKLGRFANRSRFMAKGGKLVPYRKTREVKAPPTPTKKPPPAPPPEKDPFTEILLTGSGGTNRGRKGKGLGGRTDIDIRAVVVVRKSEVETVRKTLETYIAEKFSFKKKISIGIEKSDRLVTKAERGVKSVGATVRNRASTSVETDIEEAIDESLT